MVVGGVRFGNFGETGRRSLIEAIGVRVLLLHFGSMSFALIAVVGVAGSRLGRAQSRSSRAAIGSPMPLGRKLLNFHFLEVPPNPSSRIEA